MRKFISFILVISLISFILVISLNTYVFPAVLPLNSEFDEGFVPRGSEIEKLQTERKGDLLPIDSLTLNYSDGTDSLGTTLNHWEDLWTGDGSTVALFVDGSAGNVGIGTSTPAAMLEINGTTPQIIIGDGGAEDTSVLFDGSAQDFYLAVDDTTDDFTIGTGATIGSSVQFVIENGGNVGIKTATPGKSLSVSGNAIIDQEFTARNIIFDDIGDQSGGAGTVAIWQGATNRMDFGVNGSPQMYLDSSGHVGIGQAPTTVLNIYSNDSATDGTSGILIENDGTGDTGIAMSLTGIQSWYFGIDNSDSDNLKISQNSDFSSEAIEIDTQSRTTFNGDTRHLGTFDIGNTTTEELTISGGTVTVNASYHQIDTESDAASDFLTTINGATTGTILVLRAADDNRTVTIQNSGNFALAGTDFSLDNLYDTIVLICVGSGTFYEISRSDNGS